MLSFDIPHDYKKDSIGEIEVHGNSVKVRETAFPLTPEQNNNWAREQFTDHRVNSNAKFERAYEALVMEKGLEYANEYFELPKEKEKPSPPKREQNDITEFTLKSRRRMLKKLNKADLQLYQNFLFITLTYPNNFPTDRAKYKRDLDVLIKRMKAHFTDFEDLWKLEAQKRGAPHYHILFYFTKVPNIQYLKKWISKNWYEVVHRNLDEKDPKHLLAGTNVKKVKGAKHLVYYMSKYMNKEETVPMKNQGRFWGCSRNWGIFVAEKVLKGNQLIQFKRLIKRYVKKSNRYFSKKITRMPTFEVFINHRTTIRALEWCINNY